MKSHGWGFRRALGSIFALMLLVGSVAPDVALADRGRDGRTFQPRHEVLKHRHGQFRFRDDIAGHRGNRFDHRRDHFRHDRRIDRFDRRHFREHRGHSRNGVFIGAPLFWSAPPAYYAYPPRVIAVPSAPPVYVERGPGGAAAAGYWYYCYDPEGYYPHVRTCRGAWERVAPAPGR